MSLLKEKTAIVIFGATACGKSALALDLVNHFDISIINADSLQIYEGLPILSSQPTKEDQKNVKHFLYSHLKRHETSSVGLWLDLVKSCVEESFDAKKIPVIVGGSGMYISKLFDGIARIEEVEESLKIKARDEYEEIGKEKFIEKLISLGEKKERIEKLDKQRLIRIYEVFLQTGKSIFDLQKLPPRNIFSDINFVKINLNPAREELYKNCNLRFEEMIKSGALEEVQSFVNQGFEDDWQITKTLGFLEISQFLKNEITKEKMIEIASQKTRNYAKRQLTWFRNQIGKKLEFSDSRDALEFLKSRKSEI